MRLATAIVNAAIGTAFALGASIAHAQTWPVKQVRFIVPTGPGLATDIVARLVGGHMAKTLRQPLVIENIGGAGGIVASQTAAHAAPDGYTIMIAPASSLVNNLFQFKTLPYDPVKDFAPVATITESGLLIATTMDIPARTLPELVALAKSQPGKLSWGRDASSGVASMIGQLLNKRAGTDSVEIPYKTTAQMIQDTVTGRTQYLVSTLSAVETMVKAGKLRRIALTSLRRLPSLPDLPTVSETYPGFQMSGWLTLVVPAGTPREVILALNRAVDAALRDKEIAERMIQLGVGTSGAGTPESTGEFIRAQRENFRDIVRELNIQPE
jgi:tripartite-type tricarboxylate transporter receptor subunit TctC